MTLLVHNRKLQFALFSAVFISCLATAIVFESYYLLAIPFAALFLYFGWQNTYAVFFLLLFTLPFSTEFKITETLGTDLPDEPLMILTAGLFFCHWLYSPEKFPSKKIIRHPLMLLLFITFLWSMIAVLFSTYPFISLKFLLAKCWFIGAFIIAPLIVFQIKKNIKQAMLILAIAMLLVVAIIVVRHFRYDFTFAMINDVLKPFFRNHVNYSAMLVCMIPVFFAIYKLSDSKSIKYVTVLAIVILLVALFFSYARGAWLALLTGGVAYWLIGRRMMGVAFIAALGITITLLFWVKSNDRYLQFAHDYRTTIFHENFQEHLKATYKLKDLSTAERFNRWIAGVRMIPDNALTGFGPATFYNNYKPYAIPAFKTWVSNNPEHSTVHNYFLLIAIEQGIPGLLFFLILTGAMLYYSQMLYHRIKDSFYKTIAITTGTILTMILTVNLLSDLIETDKIGSLFFLCLSTLIVADINTRKISNPSPDIQSIS